LIEDVTRLRERAGKLAAHWRQANDDVESIGVSAQKINRRADRIMQLEFSEAPAASSSQSSKPRTAPSPERGTERAPTPTLF
jgi:DNA recombination protein RmuC